MPEPDCLLQYSIGYGTLQPYLGCQRAALLRGILRREDPTYTYWRRAARASRGFKLVLFAEPSEDRRPLSEVNALYRVPFKFNYTLQRISSVRVQDTLAVDVAFFCVKKHILVSFHATVMRVQYYYRSLNAGLMQGNEYLADFR